MKKYLSFLFLCLAAASGFGGFASMGLGLYADAIGWQQGFDVFFGYALLIAMGPMLLFGVLSAALD